ncbi:MAG TPA: hypothetical protein VEY93_12380 [Longimicrobium sp.]|nr:hypothetical protein [Longimicrobium sp.]
MISTARRWSGASRAANGPRTVSSRMTCPWTTTGVAVSGGGGDDGRFHRMGFHLAAGTESAVAVSVKYVPPSRSHDRR